MKNLHLQGRRYINLVRCSSDEQADTSPKDQLSILNGFAAEYGLVHAGDDVILEGVSGSKPAQRKDIEEVVHRKREKDDFDVLLVQDYSRLTRGGIEHASKIKWDLGEVGIEVVFVANGTTGDIDQDSLIQSIGFFSAQQQAKMMSYGATRGQMSSIANGNIPHTFRPPYGIDRLYVGLDGKPRHRIRNLSDGTQQMLDADKEVIRSTYGQNPDKGAPIHYRRQSDEKIVLVAGDPKQVETVRRIYRRNLVDGYGGQRIARELNDMGVPSPTGGMWGPESIDSILTNPTYTGVGICARYATGTFHVRGSEAAPKVVPRDSRSAAQKKGVQLRPKQEWKWIPHPLLVDYLGEDLRSLAIAMQEKEFEKQAQKALAPKSVKGVNRDKHAESPYLLKDILRSKQGDHLMTGRSTGPKGRKYRYYVVNRGIQNPKSGSALGTMIPAAPLEDAILGVVKAILLDVPSLRDVIRNAIGEQEQTRNEDRVQLQPLLAERDEIASKLQDAMMMGVSSRRLMQTQFDRWEARLVELEARIAEAEAAPSTVDKDAITEAVVGNLMTLSASMEGLTPSALRNVLKILITRLVVDLETSEVEMELALPKGVTWSEGSSPLCLVGKQSWASTDEAQWADTLKIAIVTCEGRREGPKKPSCFTCSRRAA